MFSNHSNLQKFTTVFYPQHHIYSAIVKDRSTDIWGLRAKVCFWDPSPQTKGCGWLVDWLEYSCKLVGWIRFNGLMLTQQCTANIACIVRTVYRFNLNSNLKAKLSNNYISSIIIFFFYFTIFSKTLVFGSFQALRMQRIYNFSTHQTS